MKTEFMGEPLKTDPSYPVISWDTDGRKLRICGKGTDLAVIDRETGKVDCPGDPLSAARCFWDVIQKAFQSSEINILRERDRRMGNALREVARDLDCFSCCHLTGYTEALVRDSLKEAQ